VGAEGRILTVRNALDRTHPEHTAFLTATMPPHAITCDRGDFLGRARDARQVPAALRAVWPGTSASQPGDSCAAYQVHLMMDRNDSAEVTFIVGFGATRAEALELARAHQDKAEIEKCWFALERRWDDLLGSLQIDTPDATWNLLANRWLLYQSLSCRLWGRSGYFQPGGAYGFRDQLQDVLALLHVEPDIARKQLLRAAAVQFPEGDVLHWWHESPLRGVRSRCSDDLLWLPFATAAYVSATGDATVLDSRIPYLAGEPLKATQLEHYAEFPESWIDDTLYDHCCRAIEARLSTGLHGLPLIGSGDWNDGLNRVGIKGRGESVWMAWFMIRVCRDFAPLCEKRGEPERANQFREFSGRLAAAANDQAWDGHWFLRGFHDDGEALGSHASEACQIDLNAQTWAVLADAAPRDRQVAAMRSAERRLADTNSKVLRLLAPPFESGGRDVGYIQGYPPGVRENGAQYNHAAAWAVWAAAELGWAQQAREWLDWINPVARTRTAGDVERYALEPYAVAGDIYYAGGLAGRGGWSWYTGAAPWFYRVLVERLLGLQRRGSRLSIRPCLPEDWPGYRATLRYGSSRYFIQVESPHWLPDSPCRVELDGRTQPDEWVELIDDGREHAITVGPASAAPGERIQRS
jgi:cyclic beta-1,2-glucan synthetase